jgi:hypothetical protein
MRKKAKRRRRKLISKWPATWEMKKDANFYPLSKNRYLRLPDRPRGSSKNSDMSLEFTELKGRLTLVFLRKVMIGQRVADEKWLESVFYRGLQLTKDI